MNDIATKVEASFRLTDEQVNEIKEYLKDVGLERIIIATDSSGELVMDGDYPSIWVDKESALYALVSGSSGNSLFLMYEDGSHKLMATR